MCYQVIERYSVCKCLYYKHLIDRCHARDQRGHHVQEKTVLVGYACSSHSSYNDIVRPVDDDKSDDKTVPVEDAGPEHSKTGRVDDESDSAPAGADQDGRQLLLAVRFLNNLPGGLENRNAKLRRNSSQCGDTTPTPSSHGPVDDDEVDGAHPDLDDTESVDANPDLQGDLDSASVHSTIHEEEDPVDARPKSYEKTESTDVTPNISDQGLKRDVSPYIATEGKVGSEQQLLDSFNRFSAAEKLRMSDRVRTREAKALKLFKPRKSPGAEESLRLERRQNLAREIEAMELADSKEHFFTLNLNTRTHAERVHHVLLTSLGVRDTTTPISQMNAAMPDVRAILEVFLHDLLREAIYAHLPAIDVEAIKAVENDPVTFPARVSAAWTVNSSWIIPSLDPERNGELNKEVGDFDNFLRASSSLKQLRLAVFRFTTSVGMSRWTRIQRWMTKCLDKNQDPNATRLWFECSCGQTIVDDYVEVSPGGLTAKWKQLRMMSARARYYDTAPSHTGKRGLSGIINDFFRSNAAMSSNKVLLQQQRTHHGGPTSGNQDMCTKHPQSDPGGHRYLHWCFPWTRYSVRMHPLRMCHIYSDMDFFAALKTPYDATRTRSRRWLSFKKPTALRFVKFRLYHKQLVDIHKSADIPPESHKDEYDYSPMPAETIPPIGSNLLMHFFLHPEDAASQPTLLPAIPKRKRDKLEPCPVRGSSVGWGIDVTTGVDELKLFLFGLVACVVSLIFGIVWTVRMDDIQGGFGAAGFVFALLGFAVASLKALDF